MTSATHLISSLLLFIVFFYTATANATKLVWLKPIESDQVMQGNTIVKGAALDLMQFVASHINGVEHSFQAYPIKRSWHLIQNSKQQDTAYCFWGADYKKSRTQWGYFTEPTSVALPFMIAAKKNRFKQYANNDAVSVTQLLSNSYSTVIFENVINDWTKVVERAGHEDVVQISGLDKDLSDHTLELIKKGRIDFGYVSHRTIANLDVYNQSDISLYEIAELTHASGGTARLLCSKTPTGKLMANKINHTLRLIKNSAEKSAQMKQLTFTAEGYPERLRTTFEQQWDKTFIRLD